MTDRNDPEGLLDDHDRAMDARLRSHAEAWRASNSVGRDVPPLPKLTTGRAWLIPVASAVATVAAIGGVTLAVHDRAEHRATPGDGRPTASATPNRGVVPWRDLPATHPKLPSKTTPAWPSAAELAGARQCRASDVRLDGPGRPDGASGTLFFQVDVYATSSPCRLEAGYPEVTVLRNGRVVRLPFVNEHASDLPAAPVLLKKGAPALLRIDIPDHQCPAFSFDEIRVRLPATGNETTASRTFRSYCQPGEGPNPMFVEPIQSPHRRTAQIYSSFDSIDADGPHELVVATGSPARFEVTLTSPHDLSLVPCPDYVVFTDAGQHRAGLNCDAVQFRDDQGRPYLPAGVPVRFAMEAEVGPPKLAKFSWMLLTPKERVTFGGSVTMTGN